MMAEKAQVDVRGRVLLRMSGGVANPLVLATAVRVTRAFRGELRGLFIEDENLLALAGMPFAREFSVSGGRSRALSLDVVQREMQAAVAAMQSQFAQLLEGEGIRARFEVVQGMADDVLRSAFGEAGILAIGEPLVFGTAPLAGGMVPEPSGFAGLVVVGAEARRARGPIAVAMDAGADAGFMIDTAQKIARDSDESVILILAAATAEEVKILAESAEEVTGGDTEIQLARVQSNRVEDICQIARRAGCGLLVARLGGPVAPDTIDGFRMTCAIDCPVLLLGAQVQRAAE